LTVEGQGPTSDRHEKRNLIFISYAREDFDSAKKLYNELKNANELKKAGLKPWLDKEDLVPGTDWEQEIKKAIRKSRFFIPLFSSTSVKKTGQVQNEFNFGMSVFKTYPPDEIFYIPVRLDDCEIPYQELRPIHHADLFPIGNDNAWNEGIRHIIKAINLPPRPRPIPIKILIPSLAVAVSVVIILGGAYLHWFNPPLTHQANNSALTHQANNSALPPSTEKYSLIKKWGSPGTGNGQFRSPTGIAVDVLGNVYVVDSGNDRIQKFDRNGTFITKWGSAGSGNVSFSSPHGVAVDSLNRVVFVADSGNNRIQKFGSDGTFITNWTNSGLFRPGLANPQGVAVDPSGDNAYVADTGNNVVVEFKLSNSCGEFNINIAPGVCRGSDLYTNITLSSPRGVAVDPSHNVYVTDTDNNRILKFIPGNSSYTVQEWGKGGTGDGEFSSPIGISLDASHHNVYVADAGNNRIQKFDSDGHFLAKWGSPGSASGQLNGPEGVAVDPSGNVYVADTDNSRIQVYSSVVGEKVVGGGNMTARNMTIGGNISKLATQSGSSPDLTVMTDKKTYGFDDYVEVTGIVKNIIKGKTLRLDVYMPGGSAAPLVGNVTTLITEHLSDIQIKPNTDGSYSFRFQLPPNSWPAGTWTISTTYLGNTVNAKFSVQ